MSDDVKDFAYYANAAERVIATVEDGMPAVEVAAIAAIAQVLATLAAGAPKLTDNHCPERLLSFPEGAGSRPCIHPAGHPSRHETADGILFYGVNEDRPESVCASNKAGGNDHKHKCELRTYHSDEHACACGTGWY